MKMSGSESFPEVSDYSKYGMCALAFAGGISGNCVFSAYRWRLRVLFNVLNLVICVLMTLRFLGVIVYGTQVEVVDLKSIAGVVMTGSWNLQIVMNAWIFVYASYKLKWVERYQESYQRVCKHLTQSGINLELTKERRMQIIIVAVTFSIVFLNMIFAIYDTTQNRALDAIYGNILRNMTFSSSHIEFSVVQTFGLGLNFVMMTIYQTQLGLFLAKTYQLSHIFSKYNRSLSKVIQHSPKQFFNKLSEYMRLHSELCSLLQLGNKLFSLFYGVSTFWSFLLLMIALYVLSKDNSGQPALIMVTVGYWAVLSAFYLFTIIFFGHKVYSQVSSELIS